MLFYKISTKYDLLKTDELTRLLAAPHLLREDYQPRHALVVCQVPRKLMIATIGKTRIEALPWREFLENLWSQKYF